MSEPTESGRALVLDAVTAGVIPADAYFEFLRLYEDSPDETVAIIGSRASRMGHHRIASTAMVEDGVLERAYQAFCGTPEEPDPSSKTELDKLYEAEYGGSGS